MNNFIVAKVGAEEGVLRKFLSDTSDGSAAGTATGNSVSGNVTVIISSTTRLPILYNDGQILRTYRFETNGLPALDPPPKFAREFAAWRAHIAELNRIPSPP